MAVRNRIQQIVSEYEAVKASMPRTTAPETPASFQASLEERLARRELFPETREREREVIGELFGAPEAIRERFEGVQAHPSEVSGLVSDRMKTYLAELDSLKTSRKNRQARIDDIIKSVVTGYEIDYDRTQREEDEAWKFYKEAVRQREHAESLARAGTQDEKNRKNKNTLRDMIEDMRFGNRKDPNWDGFLSPRQYLEALNSATRVGQKDWFLDNYFPTTYVDYDEPRNQEIMEEGINIKRLTEDMDMRQIRGHLTDDLEEVLKDEKATIEDYRDLISYYRWLGIDLFSESKDAEELKYLIRDYLRDDLGYEKGQEIYNMLLKKTGTVEGGGWERPGEEPEGG